MTTRNLERLLAAYLVARYRSDGHSVESTDASAHVVTFATGELAGRTMRIHCGETTAEQQAPKLIISAEQGDEDFESGNLFCDVSFAMTFPVDDTEDVEGQLDRLGEQSSRLGDFLIDDALPELITANAEGEHDVTVLGVAGRSSKSDFTGHLRTHEINLRLYVAGIAID